MIKLMLIIGALAGLLAVALGAFAAHGLRGQIDAHLLAAFQTGVQYQMYHALALLWVGLFALYYPRHRLLSVIGGLLMAGMLLFSGSLYVMAITGQRWLGAVTPLGGTCFLLAWLLLGWVAYRLKIDDKNDE